VPPSQAVKARQAAASHAMPYGSASFAAVETYPKVWHKVWRLMGIYRLSAGGLAGHACASAMFHRNSPPLQTGRADSGLEEAAVACLAFRR
jgi:hypothetical protein